MYSIDTCVDYNLGKIGKKLFLDILRLEVTEVYDQLFKSVQKLQLSVGSREDKVKQESKRQAERKKKKKNSNSICN